MGQSASKAVSKSAPEVAQKVASRAQSKIRPPPPQSPVPPNPDSAEKPTSTAANPGSFLRGEGMATQDIRDVGQEMFLQQKHRIDDNAKAKGPAEMPKDLLKFIQDVGPAKQEIDKHQTSPRLLEKENEQELKKGESKRQAVRERTRMPLMGEDQTFTTTRNTNFSSSLESETKKDFGVTNLQLFDLLSKSTSEKDTSALVEKYHSKLIANETDWTQEETDHHRTWLKHSVASLTLPVLRKDLDGNIIGLHPDKVPSDEIKTLAPIPPTKVKLVLDDILNDETSTLRTARDNLQKARQARVKA